MGWHVIRPLSRKRALSLTAWWSWDVMRRDCLAPKIALLLTRYRSWDKCYNNTYQKEGLTSCCSQDKLSWNCLAKRRVLSLTCCWSSDETMTGKKIVQSHTLYWSLDEMSWDCWEESGAPSLTPCWSCYVTVWQKEVFDLLPIGHVMWFDETAWQKKSIASHKLLVMENEMQWDCLVEKRAITYFLSSMAWDEMRLAEKRAVSWSLTDCSCDENVWQGKGNHITHILFVKGLECVVG